MRKLEIKNHLSINELKKKRSKCSNAREAIRWTIIIMAIEDELSANKISKTLKVTYEVVRRAIHKYNEFGEKGLKDGRKNNSCGGTIKSDVIFKEIEKVLSNPPDDIGIWTGKKLKNWVEKKFNIKIGLSTIYVWIHKLGYSWKVPRPKHKKSDDKEKENFKKNSFRKV
jgi:transposase